MPTLVEINGLDEAGRVGEIIWLARVGVRIDSEIQILLRNLEHFDKLLVRKDDLYGRESKNLIKYVRDAIDDQSLDVTLCRMRVQTQMRIFKEYFSFLCEEMFRMRKVVIDELTTPKQTISEKNDPQDKEQSLESPLWQVSEALKRFERHPYLLESVIKSYGMMRLTTRLDNISRLFRIPLSPKANRMLVVQIDGGYPFAFWWHKVVGSKNLTNIRKKNVFITGVSQGDGYYPALSVAGGIANILDRCSERTSFLPVSELTYDENFPIDEEFYNGHKLSLNNPTFGHRMVFVGRIDKELMSCLPYCLHRADRKKTYEPFHIEISAESFFSRYGHGKADNTLVVFGTLDSAQHRKDSWYCRSKGYTCMHLADLRSHFESLCKDVEEEIDLLHKDKRAKLTGKFEHIKERFLSDLR